MKEMQQDNCYQKYGYAYSYCLRGSGSINGFYQTLSDNVENLTPSIGIKPNTYIDNSILEFLKITNRDNLKSLFYCKIGLYDEYNRYFRSEKDGFILLKTTPDPNSETPKKIKTLEIKFGRFLRAVSKNSLITLTDSEIENIYNKWVSYQNQSLLKVSYLYGNDVLKGYTRDNHLKVDDSSLQGSCMNDKHSFLELYTKNTNIVRLAIFRNNGEEKILARCIVWKIAENTYVHDRIYFAHDWIDEAFKSELLLQNITPIMNHSYIRLQLDKWKLKYYPYMDSFNLFDKTTGCLIYQNASNINGLTSQSGGPDFQWETYD